MRTDVYLLKLINNKINSDGDLLISRTRILIQSIHISWGLDSILILIKHFLSELKISKTLFLFFRTSLEYSKKYGQGSFFTTDHKCNPFPYLVKCTLYFLKKKTKVLDSFNTDKKCFIKKNIESSLQEIWIRICFLENKRIPITELPI